VALALELQDAAGDLDRVVEVAGAVDAQDQRELLARERVLRPDPLLLDQEERVPSLPGPRPNARPGRRVAGDDGPVQLAALP
jgi:hypothetical protein